MAIDDFEQSQLDLMQRRKKAQEGQTFNAPTGQMVSGRYVAPNFLQVLAEGLRGYGNIQDEKKFDQQLKDLRGKRQGAMADALKGFQTKLEGTPAVAPTTTPTQIPSFDEADAATMGGVQGYGATTGGQKAIAPDALGAYASLLRSPDSAMRSAGMTGMVSEAKTKADNATQQRHLTNLTNATTREDALAAGVPTSLIDAKFRAPIAVGNTLVDASTMKPVYKGQNKPITVGNTLVDPETFQPVYTAPEKVNKAKDLLIPDASGNLVPNTALINVQSQVRAAGRAPAAPRDTKIVNTDNGPMAYVNGRLEPIEGAPTPPKQSASSNISYIASRFLGDGKTPGILDNTAQGGYFGLGGALGSGTQAAKEFDNMREQLSTEIRTMFRIPGEGALSDKEQAQYGIQLPARGNSKELNKRILTDVMTRAQSRVGAGPTNPPPSGGAQTPMYATNGQQRIVSNDGGMTWQPAK